MPQETSAGRPAARALQGGRWEQFHPMDGWSSLGMSSVDGPQTGTGPLWVSVVLFTTSGVKH